MTLLAKRYAAALHALATTQAGDAVAGDTIASDLAALHGGLADPVARGVLTSPDITAVERQALLAKLTAGRHPLLANLVGVLLQRRRLPVLFDLYPAYRALVLAARGEVDGTAETAHPLEAAELATLTTLAGRLCGKKVLLAEAHRPELLGGVRLRVGNVLYDGSLRALLEQLEQQLTQSTV